MSPHFGDGFARDGRLDPEVAAGFKRLARRDLWVAPASHVLDHLRAQLPDTRLTAADRRRLENHWVADRLRDSSFVRRRVPKQRDLASTG